ncbi:MAG: methyltransferase domain-containing protein [Alphaproteobacteria bacterium]|nr:methyltransferase domain-containing protein [Alphaproteobacteria bacterium]
MAITRHLAELILHEHRFRPIRGDALLLGRQEVFMTPDEAQALVAQVGLNQAKGAFIDYDKHPSHHGQISDASFFSLFCDATVRACDVSDYEGAEIIFDLTQGVPDSLIGRFDFIYNGSVFDNVFDPAACMRHVARMLKPDGVVFHYEGAAHASPAYLKFTPDWLFDYHAVNRFADFQAYIVTYGNVHADSWSVYEWNAFVADDDAAPLTMPMRLGDEAMVVAIAQNAPTATTELSPLQNIYRGGAHDAYRAAHRRYAKSARREGLRNAFRKAPPRQAPQPPAPSMLDAIRGWFAGPAQPRPDPAPAATDVAGHTHVGLLGAPRPS